MRSACSLRCLGGLLLLLAIIGSISNDWFIGVVTQKTDLAAIETRNTSPEYGTLAPAPAPASASASAPAAALSSRPLPISGLGDDHSDRAVAVPTASRSRAAGNPQSFMKKRPARHRVKDYLVEQWRCIGRLFQAVIALRDKEATDIVIGANDGNRFDPAMFLDYWFDVPHHTKLFVEPVPPLFQRLKRNTEALQNVVTLNRAVKSRTGGSTLVLFCWDIDMVESAVNDGAKPLPSEARQPSDFWTALCSGEKEEVLRVSGVLETAAFGALDAAGKERVRAEVEAKIRKYEVPASTPAEIVRERGIRDAGYVQIDVEGMDNIIVQGLPLGEEGFLPRVILYENHQGTEVKPYLQSHGYEVCCCFQHDGNNMISVLNSGSWVDEYRKCEQGLQDNLEALYGGEGVDIVVGGRSGHEHLLLPAPWINFFVNVPEHRKVFVEPSPQLVKELHGTISSNLYGEPLHNSTVLQKAVRPTGGQQVELFCWQGLPSLPKELRQPRGTWDQHCAASKRRVLELLRVLDTPLFRRLALEEQQRLTTEVERHIVRYAVEALSPAELIAAAGPREEVRYIQFHADEPAAELLPGLGLGRDGLLPQVITYGRDGNDAAHQLLAAQGYRVCCCVQRGAANQQVGAATLVAILEETSTAAAAADTPR